MRLPVELQQLLDESHVAWTIKQGKRHRKVFVGGRLAAVLPNNGGGSQRINAREGKNMMAQVKRAIRMAKPA